MAEKFYTKGNREKNLNRISQVHTITVYCPIQDTGVTYLKNCMQVVIPAFMSEENKWSNVPARDALQVFLYTTGFCENAADNVDMDIIGLIAGGLKTFPKLKKINFEFTDNPDTYEMYRKTIETGKKQLGNYIYKVDSLEINLSDMFSQDVIDILNRVMAMNGIIPNSYLDRKFKIDFTFDEYMTFMNMFLGNNGPMLSQKDGNICDYLISFPQLVHDQKPDIRVITNYDDM